MNDALWLFASAPHWFFLNSGKFDAGLLSAIPAIGMVALLIGLALCLYRRDARLFLFLLPVLLSQLLLFVAGLGSGRTDHHAANTILYIFLAVQLLLALLFIWRIERSRLAAVAFAVFTLCYALFASFVAASALSTSWLGSVPLPY